MYKKLTLFLSLSLVHLSVMADNLPNQFDPNTQMPMAHQEYWEPIDQSAFYAGADFLFWRTLQHHTSFLVHNQFNSGQRDSVIGDYLNADFQWDAGFRGKLGYRFKPTFWELEAVYTFFSNTGGGGMGGPTTQNFIEIGVNEQRTAALLVRSDSTVDLEYHTGDILLARRMLITPNFLLRFFAGATAGYIRETFSFTYLSRAINAFDTKERFDIDFEGWGPKLGVSYDQYIGKGFSLFSQLAVGALVGSYKYQIDVSTFKNTSIFTKVQTLQDRLIDETRVTTTSQLIFGPSYAIASKDKWGLNIKALYEVNPWFNFYEFALSTSGANRRQPRNLKAMMCPQGLTMSATLTF